MKMTCVTADMKTRGQRTDLSRMEAQRRNFSHHITLAGCLTYAQPLYSLHESTWPRAGTSPTTSPWLAASPTHNLYTASMSLHGPEKELLPPHHLGWLSHLHTTLYTASRSLHGPEPELLPPHHLGWLSHLHTNSIQPL